MVGSGAMMFVGGIVIDLLSSDGQNCEAVFWNSNVSVRFDVMRKVSEDVLRQSKCSQIVRQQYTYVSANYLRLTKSCLSRQCLKHMIDAVPYYEALRRIRTVLAGTSIVVALTCTAPVPRRQPCCVCASAVPQRLPHNFHADMLLIRCYWVIVRRT